MVKAEALYQNSEGFALYKQTCWAVHYSFKNYLDTLWTHSMEFFLKMRSLYRKHFRTTYFSVGYSKNNVQWWKQRPCTKTVKVFPFTSKHAELSLCSILSPFSNHTELWFVISLVLVLYCRKCFFKNKNNYLCKQ